MESKSIYSLLKYLLLLLVAALLLWFSFRGVSWKDFLEGLQSTHFGWVIISMAIGVVAFWLRALRWRLAMLPLDSRVTRVDAWSGVTIGYLTNFALPRAGEFARCAVITKRRKIPFEEVVGSVVLERSVDVLSLIVVTLIAISLKFDKFGSFIQREIISGIEEKFSLNFWMLFSLFIVVLVATILLLYRYRSRSAIFEKVYSFLRGIYSGVVAGVKMEHKTLFLLYTALIWTCYWLMSYATILAFSSVAVLDPADALFLAVVGGLGWLVPVQGGIGAYHFIISLALSSIYSIERSSGVIFATISHESQAVTMILFGLLSLLFFYPKKS